MLMLVSQRAEFTDMSSCLTLGLFHTYSFVIYRGSKIKIRLGSWSKKQFDQIKNFQKDTPVWLGLHEWKNYWVFKGLFYWSTADLSHDDVKTLLLGEERKKRQKIDDARFLLTTPAKNRNTSFNSGKEAKQRHIEDRIRETQKLNRNLGRRISGLKNILGKALKIDYSILVEELKTSDEFADAYKNGDPATISKYYSTMLERSEYPKGFPKEFKIAYVLAPKELVIEYELPAKGVVPAVAEYRYIKTRDAIEEKMRKPSEIKELYQDIVAAVCLRSIHEIFESDHESHLDVVVFNGFVQSSDPTTGKDIRPCLVSIRTIKEKFSEINLAKIDKQACLQKLGAQVSPHPDELLAIKPVVEFDMIDKRFVDESDIISGLDIRPNLMDLNPFEFESLVNNLFSKMGFEAKLTRSSRDGGIDVVAFDARPILGGKVVIQAKRYKNVVGVSAVRDIYGSMINEGTGKGILVTTSHYGTDAYDFAKDKPIELIDGNGLLYLLEQSGYQARIIFPQD